jgi:methylenetetrahydrofolate dehydrogenase (NADP+)/methenyltetrahydrofolate cyclohydrolase
MECRIIDGVSIAADIRKELRRQISEFKHATGVTPTLVVLTVGNDPASQVYISKKIAACEEVGIYAYQIIANGEDDLYKHIQAQNNYPSVHAYILQLPLPSGWKSDRYFSAFDPQKDVDVFHPENVGLLVQGRPRFKPCTPHGIIVMLHRSGIKVAGKNVVVINRSNVVGKPLSSMLIQECDEYANATVTVCHDRTPPSLLKSITQASDIVIVAVGKPGFLTPDMIKPGAGVVDVGITRIGSKVLGDASHDIRDVAGWLTPVPGGVGPMTVAMLLENTLAAAKINSR